MQALEVFQWTVASVTLGMTWRMMRDTRMARRLPKIEDQQKQQQYLLGAVQLKVSIVVAARDEEARIEESVRRFLGQEGIRLELIVVDDRSTDGTGAILARLAKEDERLRVVRVEELPEGWLGKCHACHQGAQTATGDWILFSDADCWLQQDTILRAIRQAEQSGVQHVCLTPGVTPRTVGGHAWHLAFLLTILDWIGKVNRDVPGSHLGIGAFNLMTAEAYRACGGYEKLRLTVVDDVKLGLLLREAGFRTRAFIGGDDAECHWGFTALEMVGIMEKNYFAAIDYDVGRTLGALGFGCVVWLGGVTGWMSGTAAGWAATLGLLYWSLPAAEVSRRLGWSQRWGLVTPFVFPVLFYAILNSMVRTLWQGGIYWRKHFYPLAQLKAGNVSEASLAKERKADGGTTSNRPPPGHVWRGRP